MPTKTQAFQALMHNKFGKENAIAVSFVATGKEFAKCKRFQFFKNNPILIIKYRLQGLSIGFLS